MSIFVFFHLCMDKTLPICLGKIKDKVSKNEIVIVRIYGAEILIRPHESLDIDFKLI